MKRFINIAAILCISLCISFKARGWNPTGHHISAAIAYYKLKQDDPKLLKAMIRLLMRHPWYRDYWEPQLSVISSENKEVSLFMLASTWPDDIIGSESEFSQHKEWHYINHPYLKPGSKAEIKPAQPSNAYLGYTTFISSLNSRVSNTEKAIDLSWIIHLIGEIHEPMRNVSMFADDLPYGDAGGNYLCISYKSQTTNLNAFWDNLLGYSLSFNDCIKKAQELISKYPETGLPELKQDTTFQDWSDKESFPLAVQYAYLNGNLNYSVKVQGERGCITGPELESDYYINAYALAEKRIILAGIRICDYLITNIK